MINKGSRTNRLFFSLSGKRDSLRALAGMLWLRGYFRSIIAERTRTVPLGTRDTRLQFHRHLGIQSKPAVKNEGGTDNDVLVERKRDATSTASNLGSYAYQLKYFAKTTSIAKS